MKLYHHPASHNARRTVALARHLGADVELEVVDLAAGAQHAPGYLALNPNAKVPVLVDGDLVLWESTAILCYLAAKQGSALLPTAPAARADVDRWLAWIGGRLGSRSDVFLFENLVKAVFGLGAPNEAALAAAADSLCRRAASLYWTRRVFNL